ncbi:MAG: protein-methionine-sulfoxide reductase catalytic subunit MsrP [Rhodothalassiaceae bacterium]
MLIRTPQPWDIHESEATPEQLYVSRRALMRGIGAGAAALSLFGCGTSEAGANSAKFTRTDEGLFITHESDRPLLSARVDRRFNPTDEAINSYAAITNYNNFYEFGIDKRAPARYADQLTTDPWSISIEGAVARPGRYAFDDLIDLKQAEQRIYRLRCVEAWSMVIPWVGVPLKSVLDKVEPLGNAKFVQFETLYRPEELPGQQTDILNWPYREAITVPEAAHPLTFLAVGLYGRMVPPQNGAPVRLVVPWKYGFKSIKSIVAMRFIEDKPTTTWNSQAPSEYGFYANVLPNVPHPRWSQARERRIGELRRRPTLPFNGYAEAVADLYQGMAPKDQY